MGSAAGRPAWLSMADGILHEKREREREREREADCKADGLVMATRTRRGGLMARESQRPGERAPLWYAPRAGRVGYTKFRVGTVAPQ